MAETKLGKPENSGSDHIPTATDPNAFIQWPPEVREDMIENEFNGCVGNVLVSETERVRVWHLHLPPGKRCPFHRHVNPYFWSAHATGRARSYFSNGVVREVVHFKGETKHYFYGKDEYMLHSVENIGDSDLLFTTVEFLDGPNKALKIPKDIWLIEPEVEMN